jgi:hypothetical protein
MRQLTMLFLGVLIGCCSGCSGSAATPDAPGGTPDGLLSIDAPVVAFDARPPDARPPDAIAAADASLASFTCGQLSDLALPLINALDTSCASIHDCVAVFSPTEPGTCNGSHILGGDDRVVRSGWTNPELTGIIAEYTARCQTGKGDCTSDNPCLYDRAPFTALMCFEHCSYTSGTCFPVFPDAGQ